MSYNYYFVKIKATFTQNRTVFVPTTSVARPEDFVESEEAVKELLKTAEDAAKNKFPSLKDQFVGCEVESISCLGEYKELSEFNESWDQLDSLVPIEVRDSSGKIVLGYYYSINDSEFSLGNTKDSARKREFVMQKKGKQFRLI